MEALRILGNEFTIVFQRYKYKFLFENTRSINKKTLIHVTNRNLKHIFKVCKLIYKIKSCSFKINIIFNLLKIFIVENTTNNI